PDFFAAEAAGLVALANAGALRVPAVLAVSMHGIVIEDLGAGRAATADWERAGRRLAQMHRMQSDRFGFATDGYCGDSSQDNAADSNCWRFFAERRLLPQSRRAFDRALIETHDVRRLEALCVRLAELLPDRPPVLIHGDLWTGNLHACADGELALIDG